MDFKVFFYVANIIDYVRMLFLYWAMQYTDWSRRPLSSCEKP